MSMRCATATAQLEAFDEGSSTCQDLVQSSLDRITARDSLLGAWLARTDAEALAQAEALDQRRQAGDPLGALAGVVVGVKDMICTRGLTTTAGSRMLEGFVPPYDATVVARLRASDAIIVGKLNQDEFAMGSSGETSAYGVTRNPWDLDRVPGGSSSGSAAAVADGMVPLTLGTDTGGSIRQPASFCGVVGFKPTYGRVSRWGVVAFASSLDQVGPFGRSVEDCARVMEVIGGHDPLDSTSIPAPMPPLVSELGREIAGLRVGVPSEYFGEGVDGDVADTVRAAIEGLRELGAAPVPISLPHTQYAIATYYVLATAEASSNLARYDGVRYGHRSGQSGASLETLYEASRAEGFGAEVKRRILLGTFGLSAGYYDAYYAKAQRVRTLIRRDFEAAFARCDVIAAPTSPTTAFRLGERLGDPLQMYMMDICTIPASLAGLPAISVPCGFDGAGLPIGLQLMGPALGEVPLFQVAHAYERSTAWHARRPDERSEVCG